MSSTALKDISDISNISADNRQKVGKIPKLYQRLEDKMASMGDFARNLTTYLEVINQTIAADAIEFHKLFMSDVSGTSAPAALTTLDQQRSYFKRIAAKVTRQIAKRTVIWDGTDLSGVTIEDVQSTFSQFGGQIVSVSLSKTQIEVEFRTEAEAEEAEWRFNRWVTLNNVDYRVSTRLKSEPKRTYVSIIWRNASQKASIWATNEIFKKYGLISSTRFEIRDIIVQYYDVRNAERAMRELNGTTITLRDEPKSDKTSESYEMTLCWGINPYRFRRLGSSSSGHPRG